MGDSDLSEAAIGSSARASRVQLPGLKIVWLRTALVVSMIVLACTPLLVPSSYSLVENTLSESGAQGLEWSWVFRSAVILTGCAVLLMTVAARTMWRPSARMWIRVYGFALILIAAFSEAPWDGSPHDETEAFLHTVFAFIGGMSFVLGVAAVSSDRSREDPFLRGFDVVVVLAMTMIPLIMMSVDGDGLLQRALVALGYSWLLAEATRIGGGTGRIGRPATFQPGTRSF